MTHGIIAPAILLVKRISQKSEKYAALDKQHSDAERSQRGRRGKQDNKAQHLPREKNRSI